MTYIVQRKDRFYVVACDGLDPLTGKERRCWHPVENNCIEAEAVAAQLDAARAGSPPSRGGPIELGDFLNETWLPQRRRQVRATTAYRYAWFIQHYVNPAIGNIPLRRLRADHRHRRPALARIEERSELPEVALIVQQHVDLGEFARQDPHPRRQQHTRTTNPADPQFSARRPPPLSQTGRRPSYRTHARRSRTITPAHKLFPGELN